jgi:hypothetical protein
MGIVPVDPNNIRALLEGERKVNGLLDRPILVGFNKREIKYIPTLVYIMVLIMRSSLKRPFASGMDFHQTPGLDTPQ